MSAISRKSGLVLAALIFMAYSAVSTLASAATDTKAPVSPHVFEGSYQLTHDSVGMCADLLTIDSFAADDGTLNVNVGGAFFPHVNGAPQFYHDYNGQTATKAYTTANSHLIKKSVEITDNTRTQGIINIGLSGAKLTLNSREVTREKDGGENLIVEFKCEYKAITCDQTPWGCSLSTTATAK